MNLTGIHHVTAASAKIAENLKFYTEVLGLRLVKKSVNQDDVSAYHLFYADKLGSPGTDMTFFDWPHIGRNRRGTDSIAGTAFRVSGPEVLDFWAARLAENGGENVRRTAFDGRDLLAFEDPEGQRLYLVDDGGVAFEGEVWSYRGIPDDFALRGFYSIILSVPAKDPLERILTRVLDFTLRTETTWEDGRSRVSVYTSTPAGGPGTEVWLLEEPESPRGHLGYGGVHHVAFRVPDGAAQADWRARLEQAGLGVTPQIDRFWFKSIYFRVSMGILFEIATDGPGFGVDEDMARLGETLVLPPFLEGRRKEIEAGLTPI